MTTLFLVFDDIFYLGDAVEG